MTNPAARVSKPSGTETGTGIRTALPPEEKKNPVPDKGNKEASLKQLHTPPLNITSIEELFNKIRQEAPELKDLKTLTFSRNPRTGIQFLQIPDKVRLSIKSSEDKKALKNLGTYFTLDRPEQEDYSKTKPTSDPKPPRSKRFSNWHSVTYYRKNQQANKS